MNKIKQVSRIFRVLFQIAFVALPVLLAVFWVHAPHNIEWVKHSMGYSINFIPKTIHILHHLTTQDKLHGFMISLLPMGVILLVLYSMIRLFLLYERGQVFVRQNAKCFKRIGIALVSGGLIVMPVYYVLISVAMTIGNPVGKRFGMISFDGTNLMMILIGAIILLISWIMAEAAKLQEEQEYTI